MTSFDGHVISGVYTFGVRVVPPPPTEAYGAAGPTTFEYIVKWGYFLGLALVVGGLAFRLLVVRGRATPRSSAASTRGDGWRGRERRAGDPRLPPAGARRLPAPAGPACVRRPLAARAAEPGSGPRSSHDARLRSRRGVPLPRLAHRSARAALACSPVRARADLRSLAVGSLGRRSRLVLAHRARRLGAPLTACIWVGGLVQLAFVVWPTAPGLRRDAFLRFSQLAAGLVGLMVVAGAYLAYERLPSSDLWTQRYGQVLLLKSALVAVALSWGALHHFVVRPGSRARTWHGLATRLAQPARRERGRDGRAPRAAVLVDAKPPPRPEKQPTAGGRNSSRRIRVGVAGFEPATSCSQSRHSNQAELHPDSCPSVVG